MDTVKPISSGDQADLSSGHATVPLHPQEEARLASVRELEPLVRRDDAVMACVAREAREICKAEVAMLSLMELDEEIVVASVGVQAERGPRALSICAHTILQPDVLVVEDLRLDPRFQNLPCVVGKPFLRFYAGCPIFDATGLPVGALCVTHTEPHEVSSKCLIALRHLSEVAGAALESRLLLADAHARHASKPEFERTNLRHDALLLTMITPRSDCA